MNTQNPTEELSVSFTKAYEQTLKKFHSFVVKPLFGVSPLPLKAVFRSKSAVRHSNEYLTCLLWCPSLQSLQPQQLAMKACPYRATFYPKLGNPPEKVDAELKIWLEALASIVTRLQTFYVTGGHDKGF